MRNYITKTQFGERHRTAYDLDDMVQAWKAEGRGRERSIARGPDCVLVETDNEVLAAKLSRDFCEKYVNIPTCTHWDGKTLSLHSGSPDGWRLLQALAAELSNAGYFVRFGG